MTVKQLINQLSKCDPRAIVMYDATQVFMNEDMYDELEYFESMHFGINNVLRCAGSLKGFVYLTDKEQE